MKPQCDPMILCKCGHAARFHLHLKDCGAIQDECKLKFCTCVEFRPQSITTGEDEDMAKKKGESKKVRVAKPKVEGGRKPTLAPFVDNPFKIYGTYKEKEYEAQVLSSGVIMFEDKPYASPSAAGRAVMGEFKGKPLQVDGWKFWKYNEDGKRVPLDTLRGAKSPLKAEKEAEAA
jgi:hypothetical protein